MSIEMLALGIVVVLVNIWLIKKFAMVFIKISLVLGMALAAAFYFAPNLVGSLF